MLPHQTSCDVTVSVSYGEYMPWHTLSEEERHRQYSPSLFAKRPLAEYLNEYHVLSQGHDRNQLRVKGQPLLIFIHGGYWQRLSAADSLFAANDAIREHVSLHAVEYTLAPHASINTMIDECISDILVTIEELQPTCVVIAGSSAGAHLTAMCVRDSRVASHVSAAVLLSGIYDVRPLVNTPTNDPLQLTRESASAVSPQLLPPQPGIMNALCAVGEFEPSEFHRQNAEYAKYLTQQGTSTNCVIVQSKDHFDLPYDLLRRGTYVGDWTLNQLKGKS